MKHVFVVSAFSAFVAMSQPALSAADGGAKIGRYLQHEALPAPVRAAVNEISHLGRDEADFFEIERVELFSIPSSAAVPQLTKILADVIHVSKAYGPYSLAQFCQIGKDSRGLALGFDDDNECAAYLAGHQKSHQIHSTLDMLTKVMPGDVKYNTRMKAAVSRLKGFISKHVGHDFEEIYTGLDGLNVSEETVVLIDRKLGHVILIQYNQGA